MNNKKRNIMIITICMILLVTGIVAIVSTIDTNKGEYYYCGNWLMEYDKNQNVVSEKFFFGVSLEPAFDISYEYDKRGNRIKCQVEDNMYDEMDDITRYQYENDKLVAKDNGGGDDYTYQYKKDNFVIAESDREFGDDYHYKLNDAGKVVSITRVPYEPEDDTYTYTYCTCDYNKKGKLEKLSYFYSMMPEVKDIYTYEYDSSGRCSKITYESDYIQNTTITAEFEYQLFSDDYTAYVYDDEENLIEQYSYKQDKKGNLKRVIMCKGYSEYSWGNSVIGYGESYPGKEVPDNFLELP